MVMTYRVTGRATKPDEVPIVKEELQHPEPETPPPKKKQSGGTAPANQFFRFYLESFAKGLYLENGCTKYFPTRKAAKRMRNVLNGQFTGSSYNVKKIELAEMMLDLAGHPFVY